MRGRQSVNPLNKLGFSIARKDFGPIIITELGNQFLKENYDIGYIFFKSLLKLQFPNLWSTDFSEKENFNIMPFITVLHLIKKINTKSLKKGLDKNEFCLFIPTLIRFDQVDKYVERILKFREETNKEEFINNFTKTFYNTNEIALEKINNLFDYGDNIMRYFRLTRYFKITMDPLGYYWNIDIEPSRKVEIEQLLNIYSGEALKFETLKNYLDYLSDITKPILPWENKENLEKVAQSLKIGIIDIIKNHNMQITQNEKLFLQNDITLLNKNQLENHISKMRELNLDLKERIKKKNIINNFNMIEEVINNLQDIKKLKKYEPEQFEKLITESIKIIDDEILIKPNYPIDDNGEPINHSPKNIPDIECYYKKFKAICEVTLNTTKLQWVQEGQPIMRHLRDFETKNKSDEVFCIFIAPQIHNDTYSQFWISVKYEYNGIPQKIVPLTTEQFSILLKTLLRFLRQGKRFYHIELYELFINIVNETKKLNSFSDWAIFINKALEDWQQRIKKYEN